MQNLNQLSMSDSTILLFLIQMGLKSGIYGICYYNNITLISEKLRKLTYFFFFFLVIRYKKGEF